MSRRAVAIGLVLLLAGLVLTGLLNAPSWLWHPLGYCSGTPIQIRDCKGYNSWSGSFSDISEITLIGIVISGIVGAFRVKKHFECHEQTCRHLGVHKVDGTPHRTCWHHHPVLSQHPRGKVPLVHIHQAHAARRPSSKSAETDG